MRRDGDRGAGDDHALLDGPNPRADQADAPRRLVHGGDAGGAEAGHDLGVGAIDLHDDHVSVHGYERVVVTCG